MSAGVLIVVLTVFAALALFAWRRAYVMTGTALMFMSGGLAAWVLLDMWLIGP